MEALIPLLEEKITNPLKEAFDNLAQAILSTWIEATSQRASGSPLRTSPTQRDLAIPPLQPVRQALLRQDARYYERDPTPRPYAQHSLATRLSTDREQATSATPTLSSISCTSPLRTSLEPATGYRKPLFKFGKPKVLPPIVSTCSESTALCEHSFGSCTSLQENENSDDSVFSSACSSLEAISVPSVSVNADNLVSTVEKQATSCQQLKQSTSCQ